MISILDKRFRYTPSSKTDLRRTFRRIEREQKEQRERDQANKDEQLVKVTALKKDRT